MEGVTVRRRTTASVIVGACVVALTPTWPAQAREIDPGGFGFDPVLVGGRAAWTQYAGADLAVRREAAGGPQTVAEFRREEPATQFLRGRLAGSATLLIVEIDTRTNVPGDAPRFEHSELYGGPATGPLQRLNRCPSGTFTRSFDASGDAYAFRECSDAPRRVEVRDDGVPPMSPARTVGTGTAYARIAGRYVAWVDNRFANFTGGLPDVVVYDRVADTEVFRIPAERIKGEIRRLDLQDDGTLAIVYQPRPTDQGVVVGWASPAAPSLHRLPLPPMDLYDVRIAANRIAFQRGRGDSLIPNAEIGITDLRGNSRVLVRGSDAYLFGESFDYDGQRLLWRRVGCARVELIVQETTSRTRDGLPRRCRLEVSGPVRADGRTVRLPVECAPLRPPCIYFGTLSRAGRRVSVGRKGSRRSPLKIRLSRSARAKLTERGSLRLRAKITMHDVEGRRQIRAAILRVRG
jgi:hypothetical protein